VPPEIAHLREGGGLHKGSEILETAELSDLPPEAAAMFAAIAGGSKAYPPVGSMPRQARLARVAKAGAWTDAALALIELELPRWHVRRLEQEGDEWYCTLSRYRRTPLEFDDAVDGQGPSLPLAILDALLEGRRRLLGEKNPPPPADSAAPAEVVWCENVR
jgi:hypothetical protein